MDWFLLLLIQFFTRSPNSKTLSYIKNGFSLQEFRVPRLSLKI